MAILEERATIDAASPLPLHIARPDDGDAHPAVIILHEVFGLTENIKKSARRLAEAGLIGAAPELFRQPPTPYSDFSRAREVATCLSDDGAMEDIRQTLDFLQRQPYALEGKTAVMGFCMGGRLAFLAACRFPHLFRACVDFYGARKSGGSVHPGQTATPLNEAESLSAPALLFYGGKDPFIPAEEIQKVRDRLRSLGRSFDIQVYPDADHGFTCEDRSSYHPEASADAWSRALKFLGKALDADGIG